MKEYRLDSTKFLQDAEYEHLTRVLEQMKDKEPRDTLMLQLLLNTGARPSEMLALRGMDVNWHEGSVFIRGIKGSRDRDIPIPPWLLQKLKECTGEPRGEEKLFKVSYSRLSQIWCSYRPVKKALRSTRHTFAVRLYRKTKDVRLVQLALGHRWLQTTEIYLDYQYSMDEMKAALL